MRRLGVAFAAGAFALASCAPSPAEAEPFEGVWRSVGFGGYILIDGGSVEVFEYGAAHCVSVAEIGSRGISDILALEGQDQMLLRESGRIVRYERVPLLPERCVDEGFYDEDPIETLAIAVEALETHYAGVLDQGWARRRDAAVAEITADSTPAEVFVSLTRLLEPLDDPQVRISIQGGAQDGVPEGVWRSAVDPIGDQLAAAAADGRFLTSVEGTRGDGAIVAGFASDGIGYLAFTTLEPFEGGISDTGDVIASTLDGLIAGSTADTALVVDLRANDGGIEGLGMLFASRFVGAETLVVSRTARVGASDAFVEAGTIIVRPTPTGVFPGRLAVLIGPGTSGAAELVVSALTSVADVVLVGEPTAGSPSPILARALPVGWVLGVPNQRTVLSDGRPIDGDGIQPDVFVATTPAELAAGRDRGLETAVVILRGG